MSRTRSRFAQGSLAGRRLLDVGAGLAESSALLRIAGRTTVHPVHDRASLFGQAHRALKPGGRFFSINPVAYNPVINVYRRMATEVRTEDENPPTRSDIALARRFFT